MCTELLLCVFVPDQITRDFDDGRKRKMYKSNSMYFQPDDDAVYSAKYTIDLSEIEPFIAMYPSPDDEYPIPEKLGMHFDGCFVGSCTTTEEDLHWFFEPGQIEGFTKGRLVVVFGSMPIVRNLKKLGLLVIFEEADFERPAPECKLCLGIWVDVAEQGLLIARIWFPDLHYIGSVGYICSATTVEASSFIITSSDPRDLLNDVSNDEHLDCLDQ
ncbi:aconitase family [Pyrenophora seminiperda CCB06]|uniref:Aconitase family n=1 Tax=Pyrenophora seminiperda CCB06 TaxID=1302712 RepID=A0A3M7MEG4_9PLEO|nr:aconitase family [Pyrenophora seminiperda CCB06]